MGIGLVADEGIVFATEEVTEGTYVAESIAGQALEVLSDGLEFTPGRELLERNNRTSTIETVESLLGQKSMVGTVPVELKAGSASGDAPETDLLYKALLGGKRQILAQVTSKAAPAHTDSQLEIEDADIGDFAVGDIIRVLEAGAFHTSPITAVDPSGGAANITLLVPAPAGAFSASVVIEKATTYFSASGAPTLSLTNYLGGEIRQKAIGMRPVSAEISNFATGQLGEVAFGLEGLNFDREVGTPVVTGTFDTSLPPVMLGAKIYYNGAEIQVNNLSVSLTNTVGFLTSTGSKSGKISSRITKLSISGSINPYTENDDVDKFTDFNDSNAFSLFASTHNFTNAACTEWNQEVAIYLPKCKISELTTGSEDGIHTDVINFTAHKTLGGDSVFLGFL